MAEGNIRREKSPVPATRTSEEDAVALEPGDEEIAFENNRSALQLSGPEGQNSSAFNHNVDRET